MLSEVYKHSGKDSAAPWLLCCQWLLIMLLKYREIMIWYHDRHHDQREESAL